MNDKRLLFFDCGNDLWTAEIPSDIIEASRRLNVIPFYIQPNPCNGIVQDWCLYYDEFEKKVGRKSIHNDFFENKLNGDLIFKNNLELFKKYDKYARYDDELLKQTVLQELRIWTSEAIIFYKIIQPDIIIVWNGLIHRRGVFLDVAKQMNIPVFYAEKGMLPNSWYIDDLGINAGSSIAQKDFEINVSEEELNKWKSKAQKNESSGNSSWEQPGKKDIISLKRKLGIENGKKIIFFPGQVDQDSNMIIFSKYFKGALEALNWLCSSLNEEEYFILVKPHPKGKLNEHDYDDVLKNRGKALKDINIIDAINLADCVVTINSAVAFEACIYGKPVLILGGSILSNKDFIYIYNKNKTAEIQIKECIEDFKLKKNEKIEQANRFAAYLDQKYYFYKGDNEKICKYLKKIFDANITAGNKTFEIEEIIHMFSPINSKELADRFPIKMLLSSLLQKTINKFRTYLKRT